MRSIVDWFRPRYASAGARRPDDLAPLYFLHIPKTAGTSVRHILSEKFGDRLCPAGMWDDFFRAPELRTNTYDAYCGHFGIDLPIFLRTRMRVFTLLREPVARTLSHYLEVRRTATHPLHKLVSTQTLRAFAFDPVTVPMILNFQARYLASIGLALEDFAKIFTPYWDSRYTLSVALENASCYMNPATLKDGAMSALQSLEFVGITEHFDEDFRRLQQKFGFPDIPVPRSNPSPLEDARQTIAPDVEQRIRDLTSVDAEIYTVAKKLRETAHRSSGI
jgi:hypothetical protein